MTTESRMPVAPPAVGEKKREDTGLWDELVGAPVKGLEDLPIGAAFKRSRDMVEFAPTTLYIPRLLGGMAVMDLTSVMFWLSAARLTERCSDQATRPRHAIKAAPKKARIAPTQMKTVPSGRLDFCINAAPDVSGILGTGIPTPASVGAPARLKTLLDPVWVCVVDAASVVAEVAVCEVWVFAVVCVVWSLAVVVVASVGRSVGAVVAAVLLGCVVVVPSGALGALGALLP